MSDHEIDLIVLRLLYEIVVASMAPVNGCLVYVLQVEQQQSRRGA